MLVSLGQVPEVRWLISTDRNCPLMRTYPLFLAASDTISPSGRPAGCDQAGIGRTWSGGRVSRKWTTFAEKDQTRGKHEILWKE